MINGGTGVDTLDYSGFTTNVAVNLSTGTASNVTAGVANFESVVGGAGDDLIRGSDQANGLSGGVGNDILVGFGGNDILIGGAGRDLIFSGLGSDTLGGGDDDDVLVHGATTHDNDDAALLALLAEWTRTGLNSSYAIRVDNLRLGGGLNGAVTLDNSSVLADGVFDSLSGQGGFDWFWAGREDNINDLQVGEQVN